MQHLPSLRGMGGQAFGFSDPGVIKVLGRAKRPRLHVAYLLPPGERLTAAAKSTAPGGAPGLLDCPFDLCHSFDCWCGAGPPFAGGQGGELAGHKVALLVGWDRSRCVLLQPPPGDPTATLASNSTTGERCLVIDSYRGPSRLVLLLGGQHSSHNVFL